MQAGQLLHWRLAVTATRRKPSKAVQWQSVWTCSLACNIICRTCTTNEPMWARGPMGSIQNRHSQSITGKNMHNNTHSNLATVAAPSFPSAMYTIQPTTATTNLDHHHHHHNQDQDTTVYSNPSSRGQPCCHLSGITASIRHEAPHAVGAGRTAASVMAVLTAFQQQHQQLQLLLLTGVRSSTHRRQDKATRWGAAER